MSFILNIDAVTETALISIAKDGKVLDCITNSHQKEHAAFLHYSIDQLLKNKNLLLKDLDAVAVTAGPGSYTGIRVGMASAKGFCYALRIPLITVSSLEVIATSVMDDVKDETALYCAAIDAKRMEVFTAVYDMKLTEVLKPGAMVADTTSFEKILASQKIYFSGSGIEKLKKLLGNPNAVFSGKDVSPAAMAKLSDSKYKKRDFADLFYASPYYLKDFVSAP